MGSLTSGTPRYNPSDVPGSIQALYDNVNQLRQELEYFSQNMDSMNITSVDTNITTVRSTDGSTKIRGNVLEMTDTKDVKLRQGWDPVKEVFVFEMYDSANSKTLYLDSNGVARLKEINTNTTKVKSGDGSTEIKGNVLEMTDTVSTRLRQGWDPTLGKFVFEMYDNNGVNSLYLDSDGKATLREINTDKTTVKSDDGKTTITGPLIVMRDSDGIPRLKQGLDTATNKFLFQLFNSSEELTAYIDDSGKLVVSNGEFRGDIKTGRDAYVGDNLLLGYGTGLGTKTIYFFPGSTDCRIQASSGAGSGEYTLDMYSSHDVEVHAGDNLALRGDTMNIESFGDISIFAASGIVSFYDAPYVGAQSYSSQLLTKGYADTLYAQSGAYVTIPQMVDAINAAIAYALTNYATRTEVGEIADTIAWNVVADHVYTYHT